MKKVTTIKQQLIEFNEQVGWDNLNPESASNLASLLIGEAQELWEEINLEDTSGLNKYDVSLEIADVYIYLQKLCIALDIDLLSAVEDKMLINRARFLNEDYQSKRFIRKPKAERFYKIHNKYQTIETKQNGPLICGQLNGIKTSQSEVQQVYVVDDNQSKPEYLKQIVAVITPRNSGHPIWVAADQQLEIKQIDDMLKLVDYLYDIDLIN